MTDRTSPKGNDARRSNTDELWARFRASRDPEAREALIIHYAPLVNKVIGRMGLKPEGPIEWEDLINYGILGLIDAVERFEPERGFVFETFATMRIRGAVLDALRQLDPLGRLARRRVKAAQEAIARLSVELGRPPEDHEVAAAIGVSEEQYQQVLRDASFMLVSLDKPVHTDGDGQDIHLYDVLEDPDAEDALERVEEAELHSRLVDALKRLPEREQQILNLYYYDGLTMRDIADVLEISQTRVCQLHARALMNLKAFLDLADAQDRRHFRENGHGQTPSELVPEPVPIHPPSRVSARRRRRPRWFSHWLDGPEFYGGSTEAAG